MPFPDPREIAEAYRSDGFYFPLEVMTEDEAAAYLRQLQALQHKAAGEKLGNKNQLNFPHVIFRFAHEIARTAKVLDAVEAIIGPDILLWGSTFFVKPPRSQSYVSWHQDLRYWGLEDHEAMVSGWLALSPVSTANGCMRFLAGSHKAALLAHRDSFAGDNFLTRGQEAAIEIDEAATRQVELRPGEMSLHHGRLLHASAPNASGEWRIGYVMNFIAPSNRQVVAARDFAMLLRGRDRFGHFEPVPPPSSDLAPGALAWHARILAAQNDSLYAGAARGPDCAP